MPEHDYVLGTHDAEIARLGLQHRVWRSRVLEAWQRAGIGPGQTVIDVGCGPGFAALDLAEIVGEQGRVLGIERSARFIASLQRNAQARGLHWIDTVEQDLATPDFGVQRADASWCRWVLCFVPEWRGVVHALRRALRPGATAVFHEYLDYRAWRLAPRSPVHEDFVTRVMASWRADGGEPDVGLELPGELIKAGFVITHLRNHALILKPGEHFWEWPKTFMQTGAERLVSLGLLSREQQAELGEALRRAEATPGAFMQSPTVLEVIARAP